MIWGVGWPAAPALVFAILIAATDPVAVIAMFKDTGLGGRAPPAGGERKPVQ